MSVALLTQFERKMAGSDNAKSYHDAKRARVTCSEYCIVESTMLTLLENRIVQGIFCTI